MHLPVASECICDQCPVRSVLPGKGPRPMALRVQKRPAVAQPLPAPRVEVSLASWMSKHAQERVITRVAFALTLASCPSHPEPRQVGGCQTSWRQGCGSREGASSPGSSNGRRADVGSNRRRPESGLLRQGRSSGCGGGTALREPFQPAMPPWGGRSPRPIRHFPTNRYRIPSHCLVLRVGLGA